MARLAEIIGIVVLSITFAGGIIWWTSRPPKRIKSEMSEEDWARFFDERPKD